MNNSTCPEGKLEPTYWDRPDQYEYFKDLNILLSSTAPRSTSSASPPPSSGGRSSNRSAVIGGAVGGTLGFLTIIGLVIFLLWRRKRAIRAKASSTSSMEENRSETRELASPTSAGTAPPPTYSRDANSTSPPHQPWSRTHPEVSGEDTKDSPRSPFTELHSKSSLARIAELPGAPAAKELGTPDTTPQPAQTGFGSDVAPEPRNSAEKR
ncbi:hypothetical protein N0V86_001476 [Didymella sp. IMI 355093]|nr:hypothetical protein N0V86_001476 [Didymella sp. IMI 355093]